MRRERGIRTSLVAAMVGVAVISVVIATLASGLAVERTVTAFGRADLQLSADHSAAVAADLYRRDGALSAANVAELSRLEMVQGQTLVVRDRSGRRIRGSARGQARERARTSIVVRGERVGDLALAHAGGGYLRLLGSASDSWLVRQLHVRLLIQDLVAGLIAVVIGLLIAVACAVALARPIRRLTEAAESIEAGDLDTPIDLDGGGREVRRLGRTLERVAASLKQEEDVRRESVADLAHEVRTPVSGLRGRIEGLQDGVLTDLPAALSAMHADVLRLSRLMDDFDSLARAQQPGMLLHKERVDLAELTRSRCDAFAEWFHAREIDFFCDIRAACTHGDAMRLGQVVDNLLSNALRYTDGGGRVVVRVRGSATESIVEVADTGIGIPDRDLRRIFDRFWRGDPSRSRGTGGAGLGLALVRDWVRVHEGRVEVDSVPARGSRFRVHLPAAGTAPSRHASRGRA